MRGKRHSDQVRAQVMAALLAGQGVNEVASTYNIDKAIVSRWKKNELQLLQPKTKGEEIESLLFGYLTTILRTLEAQAEIVGERAYIIKQPADSLAVLHGVMADKSIRLLEASHRARQIVQQPAEIGPGTEDIPQEISGTSPS